MENSKHKPSLLIIDDNKSLLSSWHRALRRDFEISAAATLAEALEKVGTNPDIILLDIRLDDNDPDNRDGIELLQQFLKRYPDMPIVMISAYGDVDLAVECMKLGAADFVEKKAPLAEIRQRLLNALQRGQVYRKAKRLEEYIEQKEPVEIVGESQAIQNLRQEIRVVAEDGYVNVLIRGETGTGKELVARAIHRSGWRAGESFVAVPVISIPTSLLESELFGHEKGTFTGATYQKIGWIEKANGGVLFLDEIGDLPAEVQIKLLRFLEERQFTRLGSTTTRNVDVQIVAATHQNLEKAIEEGKFRQDLYYRLKGVQINLPPLRERREDIPILINYFLKRFRHEGRTRLQEISEEAKDCLLKYHWPGNVRQLLMTLERAMLFAASRNHDKIKSADLPTEITGSKFLQGFASVDVSSDNFNLSEHLARIELSCISQAIELSDGKKTEAWKLLGLNDRFALRRRLNILFQKFPHLRDEFNLS